MEATQSPQAIVPTHPNIFMSFRRKILDKINFATAAKKRKLFTLRGKIKGRKRRITIVIKNNRQCADGQLVTVDIVTTSSLNRPSAEIWIPADREKEAGIVMPSH